MEQIRCFAEKEKIVIGSSGGDISIPGLNKKLLLFGNFLYAEGKEEVFLEGKPVKEKAEITPGDRLRIKELTITFFKESLTIEGETESYQCTLRELPCREVPFEGFPYYKKSPRIFRQTGSEKITVKEPPKKEVMSKSSLAQMIIPPLLMVAVTAFIGIYMKRGLYVIASICMSIVTTIFSIQRFFSEKKELKQKNDKREEVYYDYLAGLRRLIRRKRQEERETLNFKAPEIHELQRMVTEYDSRLYERSPEDEDFLQVSLGFRSGESMIKVEYNRDELRTDEDELVDEAEQLFHDFEMIRHIPVTVNLRRTHLGIVGEREYLHNQIKYLLAQICFFQSYHDLQIVFIGNAADEEIFSYLRWYPHLRIQAVNVTAAIFTDSVRDQVLGSILQVLKERKQRVEEKGNDMSFSPHLLFVIDEPRLIRDHAIMEYLGKQSENLSISIIYTTDQLAKLPENVKTVCVIDNSQTGHLLLDEGIRVNREFETVSMTDIDVERMSRKTAAVIHEKGMVSQIPESITFFEMYHIKHPQELQAAG